MSEGFAGLDPCVHCGFCLPACPTYLATGDEADSPRGRIVLMRALERGELPADDPGIRDHLDACLGCRGCEPVCPSGVEYGRGLAAAREILTGQNGLPATARLVLAFFAHRSLWRPGLWLARMFRSTGIPAAGAGGSRLGFGLGMLAASALTPRPPSPDGGRGESGRVASRFPLPPSGEGGKGVRIPSGEGDQGVRVVLFRGCVMHGLFSHVHDATKRTLEANGYDVVEADAQACCGALHEHAGDRSSAQALAQANVTGLMGIADHIAVNSAGCGAVLKDYGHLLGTEEARAFSASIRDVSELLAKRGPREGGPIALRVAYDAPCHLQHAQRVHREPLALLRAIPGLQVDLLPGYDHCCGSAGIYSLLQPRLAREVLDAKVESIRRADPRPDMVATGNPGCLMQIGAGLRAAGLRIPVVHPVEILDWSYQQARSSTIAD